MPIPERSLPSSTPDEAHKAGLSTPEGVERHLSGLVGRDGRLKTVIERAGAVAPRVTEPGFSGMARVICGQQLSVASARAIWGRFEQLPGAVTAEGYLRLDEATVRGSGFSGGKYRTLRGVAEAVVEGRLDFEALPALPVEEAIARMTALKGIGPWTAEIYLLFCAGHPDIFPSGDLALQKAVAHGLGLETRPDAKTLVALAAEWSPHRGAAALLFWRYFAAIREQEGIML
jgi:DNA-3-methyladenine glycosylase II